MNPSDGAQTVRVLRSLCPIQLDRFDDRLRMQKLAYLIQEVGKCSDFAYYWYVRGPYSPRLTQVLFSGREEPRRRGEPSLSDQERGLADRVRSLVRGKVYDPLELELYASVWYLTPKRKLLKRDRASIAETMRRAKPHFAAERVAEALGEIEAFRKRNKAA